MNANILLDIVHQAHLHSEYLNTGMLYCLGESGICLYRYGIISLRNACDAKNKDIHKAEDINQLVNMNNIYIFPVVFCIYMKFFTSIVYNYSYS